MNQKNNPLQKAISAFRQGQIIALSDDHKRENEVDLVVAGQFTQAQHINFMITHARGIVCAAIAPEIAERLQLSMQEARGNALHRCPFAISVDAAKHITTGTSAADRACTARVLADPHSLPSDIVTPGHLFPLVGQPLGLKQRQGHTEGSIALCQMAGLEPCAIICEILNQDGSMAQPKQVEAFLQQNNIPHLTIQQLMES